MARVAVVGGGYGGLASAARLAKLGHEVTLLEADDQVGRRPRLRRAGRLPVGRRPDAHAAPGRAARPVPQVGATGGEGARPGAPRAGAAAPLGGRHRPRPARWQSGRPDRRRRRRPRRGAGAAVGGLRRCVHRRLGGAAPRLAGTALVRGPREQAGSGPALHAPDDAQGGDQAVQGRAAARPGHLRRPAGGARPAQRARVGGDVELRRAEPRRLDRARRDGRAGRGARQPSGDARRHRADRHPCPRPRAVGRAGGAGYAPPRASSRPTTSSARSTRVGCRPSRRTSSARCRPSPRSCATSGSWARCPRCPRRWCCTATPCWSSARAAPLRRARTPGPSWAADASPRTSSPRCSAPGSASATRWRCASTGPRSTSCRLWGGSPYGVLWQGRNTVSRRLGPRTPVPNVLMAGAHATPGAGLPSVGLSASLVAQELGPA